MNVIGAPVLKKISDIKKGELFRTEVGADAVSAICVDPTPTQGSLCAIIEVNGNPNHILEHIPNSSQCSSFGSTWVFEIIGSSIGQPSHSSEDHADSFLVTTNEGPHFNLTYQGKPRLVNLSNFEVIHPDEWIIPLHHFRLWLSAEDRATPRGEPFFIFDDRDLSKDRKYTHWGVPLSAYQ